MSLKNRRKRQSRETSYGGSSSGSLGTGKGFGRRRRGFAGPVLIVCAIVAVLVALDHWANAGQIYGGVKVGEVSVGGRTPEEAEQIVRERAMGALDEIEFGGPERFTRTSEEMGVDLNVAATVDEAYAVGRDGNIIENLQERLRALTLGVTIPPNVNYQPASARAEVEEIAAQVDHAPREGAVRVVGSQVEVVRSGEGFRTDIVATMQSVDEAIESVTGEATIIGEVLEPQVTTAEAETSAKKARGAVSEQLVFNAKDENWTLSPADIGSSLNTFREDGKIEVTLDRARLEDRLATVYNDLTIQPKEASYDFDGTGNVIVKPGGEGQSIEKDKFVSAIQDGLFEDKREYDVPLVVTKPEYTTAELQAQKPTELLGSYKTNYTATTDQGAERVGNLELASEAVSGTFVAPGDVFSMVEHVQDVRYNEAHVIVNSAEQTAEGGGLCQVTSTLYNAALYAGLSVIERTPHDSQLPYIRPGMDATVWYGDTTTTIDDTDMKFRNTTDGYVLIEEYVSNDGYIYANVYGVPDNVEVEMSSEEVWMTQDASEWITYYTRTKNGEVEHRENWKSSYSALYDDKGKKIPTPRVPIAEVSGDYYGIDFSAL